MVLVVFGGRCRFCDVYGDHLIIFEIMWLRRKCVDRFIPGYGDGINGTYVQNYVTAVNALSVCDC